MRPRLGFAMTGSFCTLERALEGMAALAKDYEIFPVLSERVQTLDTRFGKAAHWRAAAEKIAGNGAITDLVGAEPLGPREMLDLMLICPCTGNTLSRIARGVTDGAVTMAVKSHRRRGGKVLIALSTNDALSGSAPALGALLDRKGFYFVPLRQDDPAGKPASLQYRAEELVPAVAAALLGKQLPLFA